ncbi:hypothetical protein QCA50_008749 [Cerrena zonata]|uniref:Ribonuclease H1 N-terminal domain-containing protein n=1 Tax=Cerrena zonata TaxID=2478898 RepID=A0AAW0G6F4_9APHY
MNTRNQPPDDNPPPGRTPNFYDPTHAEEVRGLTLDDLPAGADRFLEPHDAPLGGSEGNVYVVWRGRAPGLYYRWENTAPQVLGYSNAHHRRFSNITNARIAYYLLHPERLRGQANPRQARQDTARDVNEGNHERASIGRGSESRSTTVSRDASPHSSDEYWAASDDVTSEDFVEVDRRLASLRISTGPVPTSTAVSSPSSVTLSSPPERRRGTPSGSRPSNNAEAGPSSHRQAPERRVWYFEGDEQECPTDRDWYEDKWFVVIVGLVPGVYRHINTARIASGLLPDTVICTASCEEEANSMFVSEYMRQRVRRLREE